MIMAELDKRGKGYNDEYISLKSLFFADDALMLSYSLKDAKENLDIITQISRAYGLEINWRILVILFPNVWHSLSMLKLLFIVTFAL